MNTAPNKIQSTPNNNITSLPTLVSTIKRTLTVEIFNSNNKMGRTSGNARIDINVE